MKKILLLSGLLFSVTTILAQPGKFAGTKKSMIGKVYTETTEIAQLNGWKQMEGGVINKPGDPEMIIVDVFKKGTTYLVFFSIKEDTASDKYTIYDLAEITGVQKGWVIRSSFCRQNKVEDSYIIVWGKQTNDAYMKLIKKAWRFNPDKRRIELTPVKGIDCENVVC
ncbi:MAG: hypothetical protein WBC06_12450 [Chitinophagaceae bacterium]